jgi:hypothetical protein
VIDRDGLVAWISMWPGGPALRGPPVRELASALRAGPGGEGPDLGIGATQWGKPPRTEFVVTDNEVALQGRTTGKLVLITGTGDHKGVPPYCRTRDVETVSGCDIKAAAETRIRKLGEA